MLCDDVMVHDRANAPHPHADILQCRRLCWALYGCVCLRYLASALCWRIWRPLATPRLVRNSGPTCSSNGGHQRQLQILAAPLPFVRTCNALRRVAGTTAAQFTADMNMVWAFFCDLLAYIIAKDVRSFCPRTRSDITHVNPCTGSLASPKGSQSLLQAL